jgi:hypothetical protein
MLPVARNLRASTLSRDSILLTWEYEDTHLDLEDFTVTVMRSEAEAGPYEDVSEDMPAEDVFEFEDMGAQLLSKWRDWHYRIRVTRESDGESQEYGSRPYIDAVKGSDPGGVVLESPPDLEALESIRRTDLVLKEYTGRRVLVLKHRTTGTRCPNCWDNLKRRRTISNCLTCFAVGVKGGYLRPRESFATKVPHQVQVQLSPLFEMEQSDVLMWFSNRPRLYPRDLVIDTDGRRWRVLQVQRSEKLWSLTRQVAQLRLLSRDQVEYSIPVDIDDWGRDSFSANPHRQYIRATDIDSYNAAVRNLGVREEP